MKTPEPYPDPPAYPGKPDRLFLRDIAIMAGVSYDTIKTYRTRGEGNFPQPEPDRVAGQVGRTRPWWRREVVEAWILQRQGRGKYERVGRERGAYRKSGLEATCPACRTLRPVTLAGRIRGHNSCPGGGTDVD